LLMLSQIPAPSGFQKRGAQFVIAEHGNEVAGMRRALALLPALDGARRHSDATAKASGYDLG
jgi:hypothetical protein